MSVDSSTPVSITLVNTFAAIYDTTANGQKVSAEITLTVSGYEAAIGNTVITGSSVSAVERKLDLQA
jgi:hypothetical protein